MAQATRKKFKKSVQETQMKRADKLKLRDEMRLFRENARQELATNLTLNDKQKLDLVVDWIVGVPLEK